MIEKHTTIDSQLLIHQSGSRRITGLTVGQVADLYCIDVLVSGLSVSGRVFMSIDLACKWRFCVFSLSHLRFLPLLESIGLPTLADLLFFSFQKSKNASLSSHPIPICLARPNCSMMSVRH